MYLCVCKGIKVSDAVQLTRLGVNTPEALMDAFGFDDSDSCGRCSTYINELSRLVKIEANNALPGRQEPQPAPSPQTPARGRRVWSRLSWSVKSS